ncbi:winged helix-turn-helix transcriptional regulator [Mucilaginibacter sp. SP1R1]|uniref:winged helix-turn-helix transcriptional regulator n=1 Tax=Mucilaginibacter sp. SP1R1 TaxID=2723091 RepID=UPI00160A94BD|nr:helix-turn-helix domain-containing protein [Mucilaginibacter sp. SP1R1]MBB6151446.1 DNA-binding HxlR family transcriptional regulator [Mucilaginibacter sp. SP1R1]
MKEGISEKECRSSLTAIGDALYVIGGKWKLKVIVALREGNSRFNDIQRAVKRISARVLSNELKELELNGFVKRNVYTQSSIVVEYVITDYANTLGNVLQALAEWGTMHRNKIKQERHLEAADA